MTRKVPISLLIAAVCLWPVTDIVGQNQKIGFIDSDIILQNMPEYSGIEQRLSLLSDGWRQEINELESELDELERDFDAREILFTDEIREQRLNEISQKRNELDRLIETRFGPQGDYFTRQKELLEPIQRLIFDALTRVANREDFDFVFDRANETRFLFTRQQWNLTDEVMLELGIDDPRN
ncbi:MAG: OmpH family outer membrane protein [Balneolaceae bacterium]|nr:OmpH family outer membrane protein [Balneolaceae bacterium]